MTIVVLFISFILLIIIFASHFKLVEQYKVSFEYERDQKIKMTEFYDILIRWVALYQENEKISKWIMQREYKKIAVYGMRELGILVYHELLREGIDVCCVIDKNADILNINQDIQVLKPTKELPDLDLIIVSAPHYFEEIQDDLRDITSATLVSIEDIIFET